MAHTTVRMGKNAKLYRNTGSYASPTWDEVDNVRDLTWSGDPEKVDVTVRGLSANGGWKMYEPGLRDLVMGWQMNHDPDDTDWSAFLTAYSAGSTVELLALDRATGTGAKGVRALVKVFKFAYGQPLNAQQTTDVEVGPALNSDAAPAFYTGA